MPRARPYLARRSSRRFDIIYVDACASLPKGARLLVTLFEHAALAPLGVLVTNFSKPDTTNADVMERHVHAVAAYLYGKDFLDLKEGGWTDGAVAHGYVMSPSELAPVKGGDDGVGEDELFQDVVRVDFAHYYGSFVTRHIMDIATLIAPMARLARTKFWAQLSSATVEQATARGRSMLSWPEEGDGGDGSGAAADGKLPKGGDAIGESGTHSLLHSFAMCGAYGPLDEYASFPDSIAPFIHSWMGQLRGKAQGKTAGADLAAAYYGLRADPDLQSKMLRRATEYPCRKNMSFLCDVPNADIGFFPAIAQLAHPRRPDRGRQAYRQPERPHRAGLREARSRTGAHSARLERRLGRLRAGGPALRPTPPSRALPLHPVA